MPTLDESNRAPADSTLNGLSTLVTDALAWLFWPVIGCRHRNITLPYNEHQSCLDCGATRLYLFHTDFEHADAGIFIGKWKKAPPPQSAHRIVAKTLISNAIAPSVPQLRFIEPPPPQGRCLDCGAALDPFGACPHADARDIALMSSPVNCGKAVRA